MATMVPDGDAELSGRRFETKRRVLEELRSQLSADHTVFVLPQRANEPTPDFVILAPGGLVFVAVHGGLVDVVAPPAPGARWTQRSEEGYFLGDILPDHLERAADIVGRRLMPVIPLRHRCQPGALGRGLLHVLPDTSPAFTPGIDLASAERRVLISSDLGRLGDWVARAGADHPAAPPLPPDLRRILAAGLGDMCRPAGLRWLPPLRQGTAAAAAIAAVLILAFASERVVSSPHLPAGGERHAQDVRAGLSVPAFIPPQVEWAVRGALEVARKEPDRDVRWRHDGIGGTVRLLPRDGRPCRAFRVSLDTGDTVQSEDRRYCG